MRSESPDSETGLTPAAGLLPAGLRDVLPPRAEWEAQASESLLASFRRHGYARVKPPLIEFEETLLAGSGQDLASQMFRVMDPVSQRMMALRNDITLQVARIAATRLRDAVRPLRVAYAGQVLRVRGSQLRPERQFAQAGFELIGSDALAADVEVAVLAAEAVAVLGVPGLSLDITQPLLAPAIMEAMGLEAKQARAARRALDRKDAAELKQVGGNAAPTLLKLLELAGPARAAVDGLKALKLPAEAAQIVADLDALVREVSEAAPDLLVTLDPGEFRGFEYHMGISFTLFARNVRGELGRGGRYVTPAGEPATGFTLYLDSVMRALPPQPPQELVYLPFGTPRSQGAKLRREGHNTWAALQKEEGDIRKAAKAAGCSHWWDGKAVQAT
ncbi:ATP phosphoribosyltransferase regulatory subunit [uncultured Ferrovibrio sp.]|uniref:ATP phosphoribosyltransferase regulatory subunit n=1 Tax=uncultured Ferrovibrio sp. TaxID=1576913 RepID=UPI0026271A6C|nr:ATP phosphoribosyltransferase regulatory subunit [uncultured Ferrovibrio sp.]